MTEPANWLPRVALFVLCAASIAGCAATPTVIPATGAATDEFRERVEAAIEEATAAGASENQREALTAVLDAGEVSLSTARDAMRRTVECIAETGVEARYVEQTIDGALVVPTLTYGGKKPGDLEYEACSQRESSWIDYLYQTQPSAMENRARFLRQQLPMVRACLEESGNAAPPGEDLYATLERAHQLAIDSDGAVNCLSDAGIVAY